jgi:hypothetical protein
MTSLNLDNHEFLQQLKPIDSIQNNITGSQRSVIIRVVYCSSHVDYTLTQGRGPKKDFNIITLGKDELKN